MEFELALEVELDIEALLVDEVTLEMELEFPRATAAFPPSEQALIVYNIVANSAIENTL